MVQVPMLGTAGETGICSNQRQRSDRFASEDEAKGIATTKDFHYHCISSKLAKPFSSKGKTLVLQFSVKHEKQEGSFCGGGSASGPRPGVWGGRCSRASWMVFRVILGDLYGVFGDVLVGLSRLLSAPCEVKCLESGCW